MMHGPVAARLGIPHYVLDYESRFNDQVMQDFADSYLRGETPIPCVRCNQTVKFTDLLATARDLDADCLATGHYVQRISDASGTYLCRGVDATKDQSYFFATTPGTIGLFAVSTGRSLGRIKHAIWRANLGCRYPTSRTVKISVLCRMVAMEMWSAACARGG